MAITINRSWHEKLQEEIDKPYIKKLKNFLYEQEQSGRCIFPPSNLIFNALSLTPYNDVKVVIMGQDPYHGPGQAMGLSFSVPQGVKVPPSLANIYKELKADLGIAPPNHGNLENWAKQGVLLLNATLTVEARSPKSHYGLGWERFTDKIVEILAKRIDPLVFVLWGKSAKEKVDRVLDTIKHPHLILSSAHPSPYSATGFFGCRHFSKINKALINWNKEPIDWQL